MDKNIQKIAKERRLFTDHENLVPFGLSVDNSDIHQLVIQDLLKYSVSLKIGMITLTHQEKKCFQEKDAEGQGCFLQTANGIVMATMKHNFCKEISKEGHLEACRFVYVTTPGGKLYPTMQEGFALMNWDARSLTSKDHGAFKFNSNEKPNAAWKYGKELEFIPLRDQDNWLVKDLEEGNINTFEAVCTAFECKVGMQVGIMACSCVNLLATSMQRSINSGSEDYEAQQGGTFITVGTITHVGEDHVECSVNTVPGVSGAPVFLLTGGDEHHMKRIAIHAGFSEGLGENFGFLVAKKVEEYGAEGTCVIV